MKSSGNNFQAVMKTLFGFFDFSFLHPCCKIMDLTDSGYVEAKKEQDVLGEGTRMCCRCQFRCSL